MVKPLKAYVFRMIDGMWIDAGTNEVLADVLSSYGIIVDDRCQFARLYDYEQMVSFHYRADGGKIELSVWKIFAS